MFSYKSIICLFTLVSSGLAAELYPQRGKVCKITDKTKVEVVIFSGDGNAVKCADNCLATKGCKGIEYRDDKNKCTKIMTAMWYDKVSFSFSYFVLISFVVLLDGFYARSKKSLVKY